MYRFRTVAAMCLALAVAPGAIAEKKGDPWKGKVVKDWNINVVEEEMRDGRWFRKFTYDSSAIQEAAVAGGAEPIPDPVADPVPIAVMGYPAKGKPTRLVVLCHGLNGDAVYGSHPDVPRPPTPEKSFIPHIERIMEQADDIAVVATNYRDNFLFPVGLGAHDTIAVTQAIKEQFKSIETVYLLGVSMGGAVSGTAISESRHVVTEDPVFDHWIAAEPLAVFIESYYEAKAALPSIAAEMEQETGGTPQDKPGEYQRRTDAMNAHNMANAGLKTITIVHSVNDGLTPYNQARTMATAAVQAGIPTQLITVGRKQADHEGPDYTGTGTVAGVFGVHDDPAAPAHLAGHAADWDHTHPVMRISFEQLNLLLNGDYDENVEYMEHVFDDH